MDYARKMDTRRNRVTVLGSLNVDYQVHGGPLPRPGETTVGVAMTISSGGKGGNQAVAASRLGAGVVMIARVGYDDCGLLLKQDLDDAGIDTSCVTASRGHISGSALIMVDTDGEKQIMVAPGANHSLGPKQIRAASASIARSSVLLTQLESPVNTVLEACTIARESRTIVVLDAGPAVRLPSELLTIVNVLRCNAHEARSLTGIDVVDASSANQAANHLLEQGVGAAIVQAGSDGNLIVTQNGTHLFPHHDVASIDATGAGDAFAAALAVEIAGGSSLLQAACFASAAAALSTTVSGARAGLPYRASVVAMLEKSRHA